MKKDCIYNSLHKHLHKQESIELTTQLSPFYWTLGCAKEGVRSYILPARPKAYQM